MSYTVEKIVNLDGATEYVIRWHRPRTLWQWLRGRPATVDTYIGSCTVWMNMRTGRRPSTMTESRLADMWACWRHQLALAEHQRQIA